MTTLSTLVLPILFVLTGGVITYILVTQVLIPYIKTGSIFPMLSDNNSSTDAKDGTYVFTTPSFNDALLSVATDELRSVATKEVEIAQQPKQVSKQTEKKAKTNKRQYNKKATTSTDKTAKQKNAKATPSAKPKSTQNKTQKVAKAQTKTVAKTTSKAKKAKTNNVKV